MLLTEARRPARTGARGELISLEGQDRTRGDKDLITEGTTLISAALRQQRGGYYQLQAAIAAIHDEASTTKDTGWPQIFAGNHRLDAVRAHLLERAGPNPRFAHVNSKITTSGGAEGTRTPDPHTASVVRYQLRHSPAARRDGHPRHITHAAAQPSHRHSASAKIPVIMTERRTNRPGHDRGIMIHGKAGRGGAS